MMKKCPRYERPTSYHKLNFCIKLSKICTVFYICFILGRSSLGYFFPVCFNFHGFFRLLVFRFLWGRGGRQFSMQRDNSKKAHSVILSSSPPTLVSPRSVFIQSSREEKAKHSSSWQKIKTKDSSHSFG
jgi:hypothetical protein